MVPKRYQVKSFVQNTRDVFTLILSPLEEKAMTSFLPGQFNMLYLYGFGEIPISISSDPSQKDEIAHTIRAVGAVTQAMQKLEKGDEIGVRGPFGSAWPFSKKGSCVLLIAGGLGFAPLKPALLHLAACRDQYKKISLLYGTRSPEDILYESEMKMWKERGIDIEVSVDKANANWRGNVGVVTSFIGKHVSDPQNTRVFLCGPEIMMKFALLELMRFNIPEDEIYLSLERNMKCATGFCGHCLYGPFFICKNGPIFSYSQLKTLLPIKEL